MTKLDERTLHVDHPRGTIRSPLRPLAYASMLLVATGCDTETNDRLDDERDGDLVLVQGEQHPAHEALDRPDALTADGLVYHSTRRTDAEGNILDFAEEGRLPLEAEEHLASPWNSAAKGVLYQDEAMVTENEDGTLTHHYRVWRKTFTPAEPQQPEATHEELEVQDAHLSGLDPEEMVDIAIEVTGYHAQPLPNVPHAAFAGEDELRFASEARWAAHEERRTELKEHARALLDEIERAGGRVLGEHPMTGWVVASLPAGKVRRTASEAV